MTSKRNIRIFKSLSIALPFVLVLAIELILKYSGLVPSLDLFIDDPKHEGYMVQNPYFSKRYFSDINKATVGFQEPFKKNKDANTFRIVVQGASTAVGFPYFHNGSFHRMLRYRLEQSWPDKNVEVINVALTAINSYTLADQAKEIIAIHPDAVLIYAGHNEYYGALGVAASGSDLISHIRLRANKLALVQVLNSLIYRVEENSKETKTNNLMEKMAEDAMIIKNSKRYRRGLDQFARNMDKLMLAYKKSGLPVFISTIASNIKDQPPFESVSMVEGAGETVKRLLDEAENHIENGDHKAAGGLLMEALELDSGYADTQFAIGRLCFFGGEFNKAKRAFMKAKELDALRFRAPDQINVEIGQLAQKYQAELVDANALLEAKADQGIIGQELMLEHLHPNLLGNGLIAEAFYESLIHYFGKDDPLIYQPYTDFIAQYPATVVDTLVGDYATQLMKEQWPFNIPTDPSKKRGASRPEEIAGMMLVDQASWDEGMEMLYQYYQSKNQQEKMLKVAEATTLEHPLNMTICATTAQLFTTMGDYQKAVFYFKKAFQSEPNALLARKIAQAYIQQGQLRKAAKYLGISKQLDNSDKIAPLAIASIEEIEKAKIASEYQRGSIDPLISLAINYLKLEVSDTAYYYLLKAKALDPQHPTVLKLDQYFNE